MAMTWRVTARYMYRVNEITITFLVLGAVVVLFAWNRLPVEIVVIGAGLTLYATGILDVGQVVAGYGDPTVIFIASLFVVSAGLEVTGVTTWAGQQVIARAGEGRARLLVLLMGLVAGLTALISVNGAVAALVPMVVVMAVRLGRSPSQLLIPLAFAAHAGSMLALTGTPVNVIVSELAVDSGAQAFGFFEFALVGVPLLLGTIAIVVVLGPRLLPARSPDTLPPDLSEHARTLTQHYEIDDELLASRTNASGTTPVSLITREHGVAEVVIAPRSGLIGSPVFPGMVTSSGDLVVLAIDRRGESLGPKETPLEVGDTLLVQGTWNALDEHVVDPDVLVVDEPDLLRRQIAPMGAPARRAVLVLLAMVTLLATGAVPPVVAGLLAAGAMILLGVQTVEQAYRSISWTTVILVGGMLPISVAIQQTGAAGELAHLLIGVVGDAGPYALLVGLFVLTAVLGQLISNTATVLVVAPIALSAAVEMGVSGRPVLMLVNVAAAAAFLTPVATPANMMVLGPGGYRFGDYWKLGLPLLLWFLLVSTLVIPVFWPL